jgi:hypothetical protein
MDVRVNSTHQNSKKYYMNVDPERPSFSSFAFQNFQCSIIVVLLFLFAQTNVGQWRQRQFDSKATWPSQETFRDTPTLPVPLVI